MSYFFSFLFPQVLNLSILLNPENCKRNKIEKNMKRERGKKREREGGKKERERKGGRKEGREI
jgi:hypothetical protein